MCELRNPFIIIIYFSFDKTPAKFLWHSPFKGDFSKNYYIVVYLTLIALFQKPTVQDPLSPPWTQEDNDEDNNSDAAVHSSILISALPVLIQIMHKCMQISFKGRQFYYLFQPCKFSTLCDRQQEGLHFCHKSLRNKWRRWNLVRPYWVKGKP